MEGWSQKFLNQEFSFMQVGTMRVQPGLCARHVGASFFNQPPETPRVIHLDEMGDLVHSEIIEHEWRRQNEAPRI
jgi:hypothetical protein